jgi:hypothetical protein
VISSPSVELTPSGAFNKQGQKALHRRITKPVRLALDRHFDEVNV